VTGEKIVDLHEVPLVDEIASPSREVDEFYPPARRHTIRDAMTGDGLKGVAKGMTVVEDSAQIAFIFVLFDHARFDFWEKPVPPVIKRRPPRNVSLRARVCASTCSRSSAGSGGQVAGIG
jgi:hypothetical protein